MPAERIYLYPGTGRGLGSGHLRRCGDLSRRIPESALLADDVDHPCWKIFGEENAVEIRDASHVLARFRREKKYNDTFVVFDRRQTQKDELILWSEGALPVLWDDDGPARRYAPFVIDTIPGPRRSRPNVYNPSWMDLPPMVRKPDPAAPILVTFGGTDEKNLTPLVLNILLERILIPPETITVTLPLEQREHGETWKQKGVCVLKAPRKLKSHLKNFGLVITSYGLTAWESIAAGAAVITVDPSRYHAQLSRKEGFPGTGFHRKRHSRELKKLFRNPDYLIRIAGHLQKKIRRNIPQEDYADFLERLNVPAPRCAMCSRLLPPIVARFPERSYYVCPECKTIGLYRFHIPQDEYGLSYFQEDYRKQYGKSYMDDFENIRAMGLSRLEIIGRAAKPGSHLLDIGCAFGPFMKASSDAGYKPYGVDVSDEAVHYVKDTLGFPAGRGVFPKDNPSAMFGVSFNVITLWYVIEHFEEPDKVLRLISNLLPAGGVLAFSTPNGAGVSARKNRSRFLENSPADHYTIWTPRMARRILRRYGFRVFKTRVTGHHPERFGTGKKGQFLLKSLLMISRFFSLGDTFEVYAIKENSEL